MNYSKKRKMTDTREQLFLAVRQNECIRARELIDPFVYSDGYQLLQNAVEHNHTEMTQLLLDSGCRVNTKNTFLRGVTSDTPLHYAVKNGNKDVVQLLLSNGAAVEVFDTSGKTPLHYSVQGLLDITEQLLRSGANVNCISKNSQYTPLHCAVEIGDIAKTNLLLNNGATVNSVAKDGFSPMLIATRENHFRIVERLLSREADVSVRTVDGFQPLHFAASNDNEDMIQLLLDKNAEVNALTNKNQTPLHIAIENHSYKAAFMLLNHGSKIDSEDDEGKSILHLAVEKGNAEIVREILKLRPDIDNNSNKNAFKVAALYDDSEVVQDLIEYGFTVGPEDVEDGFLLHSAVQMGYFEIVKDLLRLGANVSFSQNGYTPLHTAVKNNQVKMASLLIEHGADVNAKDKKGKPPIFYAVCSSNLVLTEMLLARGVNVLENTELVRIATNKVCKEIVQALIENNFDIGATDMYGRTALHLTAENQHDGWRRSLENEKVNIQARGDIAKLLLKNGADVNAKTKRGFTTLHLASQDAFSCVVEALLEYKADVESLADGYTPLIISAFNGNSSIIEILLKNGANINAKDQDNGRTALHYAAEEGYTDALTVLLKENPEVNSHDIEGQTPLHLAASMDALEAVEVLLKHGANIDDVDNEGQTALHVASEKHNDAIVELLLKFGADVNIMTKLNCSPLDVAYSDNKDDNDLFWRDDDYLDYEGTREILIKRLIIMKIGNLYINKKNKQSVQDLIDNYYIYENLRRNCREEVERMKNKQIKNTKVKLYDILSKDIGWLAKYAKNEDIVGSLISECYENEFPIYFADLRRNIKKGVERKDLLEQGQRFFEDLLGFPYACADQILQFLSNIDIKSMIQAYEQSLT